MLKNYIIIAWRNLLKHKFHSALNILGLSIGIGFTLLIGAYVWSELQVNKALKNADHQYIIQSNWTDLAMGLYLTTVGPLAIIGIVKDFHFGSMKNQIKPIMLMHVDLSNVYRLLCFKIKPRNVGKSVEAFQKKWSQLLPGSAFEYRFMDESLKKLYQTEIQLQKASHVATALSLIIVVLGIISLISLSIQKRIKEIGIRKILGASASNVTYLFLKDFLPVIMIGGIISIPVAWFMMQSWLNEYTYRISITLTPFLISFFILGFLTTVIIMLQTVKSAVENPVKNLRSE